MVSQEATKNKNEVLKQSSGARFMKKPRTINAFCDDALSDLDAVGVAERIAKKEISATEAVEAAIGLSLIHI